MRLELGGWRAAIARYQHPDVRRSVTQIVTTLVPLATMFYLMYVSLSRSHWLTLLLAIPTAGLMVRTFIIMHDCGHGSFLPSQRWNNLVGWVTGVLTLTPYGEWTHEHAIHHATSGDLDRRGHGDIATLTVDEYLALGNRGRLKYRFYRNPFVVLLLGPVYMMLGQRVPGRYKSGGTTKNASVWSTNLGIAIVVTALALIVGIQAVLLVYLPTAYLAAGAGVYLFYVQHQFDGACWERHAGWDYATAAISGCSHLKLPRVLQWFTGNIGLHHVHHLAPRVPNYNLQRAHDENPMFQQAHAITLAHSVGLLRLALWDERQKRLIRFADVPALRRADVIRNAAPAHAPRRRRSRLLRPDQDALPARFLVIEDESRPALLEVLGRDPQVHGFGVRVVVRRDLDGMALGHPHKPERHVELDDLPLVGIPHDDVEGLDRLAGLRRLFAVDDGLAVLDDEVRLLALELRDDLLEVLFGAELRGGRRLEGELLVDGEPDDGDEAHPPRSARRR